MVARPFGLRLEGFQVALVSERQGIFTVEPMQFLFPGAARAKAKRLLEQERARTGRVYRNPGKTTQAERAA